LGVLDQPTDPTLDYALWLTINDLGEPWMPRSKAARGNLTVAKAT